MRTFGLAGRLIVSGILIALLVSALAGWTLRTALHGAMRSAFDQRLEERADLILARFDSAADKIGVNYSEPRRGDEFGRIFSGWYWRLDGGGTVQHSRSLWDADIQQVKVDESGRLDGVGPEQAPVFGIVRSVELGSRPYRLEVYGPAAPVLQELSAFDRMLFWIVSSLVVLLVLATVVQARVALRPLARLRAAMNTVEQGEADMIGRGYGPDLDPLARELDGLLKRNAQIVERARGHAADLAHALKKPLALLRSEADVTRAVPAELVQRESASMARLIDRHLARAGSGAGDRRRIDVFQHVNALVGLMRQLHRARALDWQLAVPEGLSWRGEATDFEEMLGNLLDNAGKWASHQVRVTAVSTPAGIEVAVDDDGPGLSAEQRVRATQRWQRFDESVPGTGLGLGITADIAATYEGDMALFESSLGGLRVVLNLPQ